MTTLDPAIRAFIDIIDPPRWEPQGRLPLKPHQRPPDGQAGVDWTLWILAGGRGAGKTEGGSRYFAAYMRAHPGHRGRIIAPTLGDAVESCVSGPSGLLSVDPEVRFLPSSPGGAKVIWPNGSEAILIGTPTPRDVDRLRASGNRHIDWWEEMAANPQLRAAWGQAAFGLRLGESPHSIATTTPRTLPAYRERVKAPGTVATRGTIFDNPTISDAIKEEMRRQYEGTRIGRQELYGELIEDVEGALWTGETIEAAHLSTPDPLPDMARVVVAIDPAVSTGEDADETGIIVVGLGVDGRGYVLADRTCHLSPDAWARRAVAAYEEFKADRIIAEKNQGGDLVESVIRTVSRGVSYAAVNASRGKRTRAEPVAALYEQGRVSHAVPLAALEDQLTTWTPESGDSPDRLDALVWGITYLGLVAARPVRTTPRDQVKDKSRGRPLTAGIREQAW